MSDPERTRERLLEELAELRARVAQLEATCDQRDRAEQDLRESQRRLATLLSNLPGMAYRCRNDAQWTMEFVSEGCFALTGYQRAELIANRALSYNDCIVPEDRSMVRRRIDQALAEGRHFQIEYRIRTAGGEEKWVWEQGIAVPAGDAQGPVIEGFIADITERKRAAVGLQRLNDELERRVEQRTTELSTANQRLEREVEDRRRAEQEAAIFKRFVETSGQGFGMADLQGYATYVNPALCRMLGEDDPADVIGQHFSAYCPEEYRQQADEKIMPGVLAHGQWDGESAILTRQGRRLSTLESTFLIRDDRGVPLRLALAVVDQTERKQAEEALRQAHEHLQAVFDGMVEGFVIFDIETFAAVSANPALCRMMGYTEPELKALTPEQKHPADWLLSGRAHYEQMLREGFARSDDVPMFHKDGRLLYFEIVSKRIVYAGRPSVLIFFHDVTARREALDALQKERHTLWHLLQASDHERQLIAYEIHDGLAQYLAAAGMQFQSYLMLRESDPAQAQKAFEAATQLVSQSHFEARRLISGVRPPVLDEAGLETAIAHLVHDERVFKGLKIELQSEVQFDRLPAILENALYRIAQESLTNAWKHSRSKRVRVKLLQDGPTIRLEVQDWGVGFDPRAVERGHFGLEGIRERVRLLGGRLEIRTAPGEGTLIQVDVSVVERKDDDALGG